MGVNQVLGVKQVIYGMKYFFTFKIHGGMIFLNICPNYIRQFDGIEQEALNSNVMHNKVEVEAFVITKVALKKSSSADALTRGSITTGDDRDLLDYLNFACSFIEFSTSPSENHSKNM